MQINFFDNKKFRQELFDKALLSYKREDKITWTENIVRTNLPVLAIESKIIDTLVKEIKKDKTCLQEFLLNAKFNYYESTIIYAKVLNYLQNFDDIERFLTLYVEVVDNWASCDALSFRLKGEDYARLLDLAISFTKSNKPFERRVGFRIFFGYINDDYIDKIFKVIDNFYFEEDYYVNMIIAWLLCEMFIKNRQKTLEYIKKAKLNKFVQNKFISKCNDSFRVAKSDKLLLKSLKI